MFLFSFNLFVFFMFLLPKRVAFYLQIPFTMSDTADIRAVVRRRTGSRTPLTGVDFITPQPPPGLHEDSRPPQRGLRFLPGTRSQGPRASAGLPQGLPYPLCPQPVPFTGTSVTSRTANHATIPRSGQGTQLCPSPRGSLA